MKKKWLKGAILIVFILYSIIYILKVNVTTQQGINYQWYTIEMPLYLKILDFFDRHYNYKWLAGRIINDSKSVKLTEKEKGLKIFKWTYENIKKTPENYPVIDDHVWHIIIRGYGQDDQSSDVFTTLCNYLEVGAFFSWVYTEDHSSSIPLSFVKIDGRWNVFDPYNGVYFKDYEGNLASIEEIIKGNWIKESIGKPKTIDVNYLIYLNNLSSIRETEFNKANIQSPINRLKYEIKKLL